MGLFDGGIGDFVSDIGDTINEGFSSITPWNDESEGAFGIAHITPWNDETEGTLGIGKLTPWDSDPSQLTSSFGDGAALAALIYGGAQAAGAAQAAVAGSTTAGATATTGSAGASLGTGSAAPSAFLANAPGVATQSAGIGASMSAPGMASQASGGQGLFGSLTSKAGSLGSSALDKASGAGSYLMDKAGGIGSWAKSNPMMAGSLGMGALQGVGGYFSAKEQAEAQKEMQKREMEARYRYGGSGIAKYLANNLESPTAKRTIQTSNEAMQRMRTDPSYRKGFETAAAKFTDPATAQAINEYLRSSTSQAGLYSNT